MPKPRPVPMAGRVVLVNPATIRMLAELQDWVDSQIPDPFASVWPLVYGENPAQGEDRWGPIRKALKEAPDPIEWDSREGSAKLATLEGVAYAIWLACRPAVTPEIAAEIVIRASGPEIAAFRRAFYGINPEHELYMLLFSDMMSESPPSASWPEAVCEVMEKTGWTLPQIYDLTLAEFGMVRRGGKEAPRPSPANSGDPRNWKAIRERLFGPDAVGSNPSRRDPDDRATIKLDPDQPAPGVSVEEGRTASPRDEG